MTALNDYSGIVLVYGSEAVGSSNFDEVYGDKVAESNIKAGSFITTGTANGSVKEISAGAQKIIGYAVPKESQIRYGDTIEFTSSADIKYQRYTISAGLNVPYVLEGARIRLLVSANVLKAEAVYVDVATGFLTNVSTNNIRLGNSFFEQDVLAGNFAIINFHLA
jgi:hypothetical protein